MITEKYKALLNVKPGLRPANGLGSRTHTRLARLEAQVQCLALQQTVAGAGFQLKGPPHKGVSHQQTHYLA